MSLQELYQSKETHELLLLFRRGGLTEEAAALLADELRSRGEPVPAGDPSKLDPAVASEVSSNRVGRIYFQIVATKVAILAVAGLWAVFIRPFFDGILSYLVLGAVPTVVLIRLIWQG